MADSKLSLKNIHHVYEQKKQAGTEAIRHIDLEVRDGELLAIVGASGCGKSTLLKLIVGLDHPTSGQIKVGERVVTEPSLDCGIIFQEARLYPRRIRCFRGERLKRM